MFNYDMGGGIRYDSDEYRKRILGEDNKDGGPGSGNWGHSGRPGKIGGSGKGGGKQNRTGSKETGYSSKAKKKQGGSGSSGKTTGGKRKTRTTVKTPQNKKEAEKLWDSLKEGDKIISTYTVSHRGTTFRNKPVTMTIVKGGGYKLKSDKVYAKSGGVELIYGNRIPNAPSGMRKYDVKVEVEKG